MRRPAAALAVTASLLALLSGAAPASAASRAAGCAATVAAEALLTTTVVPMSSAQLVGTTTTSSAVRVDARSTDASGAVAYHLQPGTVVEVRVAQGLEAVSRIELATGAWVRGGDVAADRAFLRCAKRLG